MINFMTQPASHHRRVHPLARLRSAVAAIAAVALVGVLIVSPSPNAGADELIEPAPTGPRNYTVHVPPTGSANRPLVVFLHGCSQTGEAMAAATGFNELADAERFSMLYIDQNNTFPLTYPEADGNGLACWNWFHPDHQQRDQGEPGVIADITRQVVAEYSVDPKRVYVVGMSAGANMAVIMAATYPDVYAAIGTLAGCPYADCTDLTGLLTYEAMAERARPIPLFMAHGTADTVVPFPVSLDLLESWLNTNDWVNDGEKDGSVSKDPYEIEHRGFDQNLEPASGDPCVRPQNWPCFGAVIGYEDEYPHSIFRYRDYGCSIIDFWMIHGMEHAWPNAPAGPFTDPLGPDLRTGMWEFLSQHHIGRPCIPPS